MPHFIDTKKASHLLLAFFVLFCTKVSASSYLSIIIDDIGDHYKNDSQALSLPGAITYALLPYSPFAKKIAKENTDPNKEFILHTPMQSIDSRLQQVHTLHMHMTEKQFKQQLINQIKQFPFIKGINNHMGSLLTMHPAYMTLFMKTIKQQGPLYFIDSRTTVHTVAEKTAHENKIPVLRRDIFLDAVNDKSFINQQLDSAIKLANKKGFAVAIAHPYPETIAVLRKRLSKLRTDIKLVPVSSLIKIISEPSHEKSTGTLSAGL